MNHATIIASAGAFLLATSALTSVASAQVVRSSNSAPAVAAQVSSSYGGGNYYPASGYTTGYAKTEPFPSYLYAQQAQAVPVPAQMPVQPTYATGYSNYPAPYEYAAPVAGYGAPMVAGADPYADPYAAAQPAYGNLTVIDASSSAAAAAAVIAPVPQYIEHEHEFQEHEHDLVEHSHGYEAHHHAPNIPGAHYPSASDHGLLGENIHIGDVVVSGAPIDEIEWQDEPEIPSYDHKDDDMIIIDNSPHYGTPTVANALRLSAGYGYATAGNFGYGIAGDYTEDSADPTTWPSDAGPSYIEGTAFIDEELRHQGIYGSLRGDIGNFFIDAVGGIYTVDEYTIDQRYNLAKAYHDGSDGSLVGPAFPIIDGTPGYFTGQYVFLPATDGVEGDEYDSIDVTATITSQIDDFGAAAGYTLNIPGVPLKVGLGVAGKSLSRTTTVDLTSQINEVTSDELFLASFDDHTYTETVSGTYAGPTVRVNFDPRISSSIGLHLGGSVQALYGNSNMTLTQESDLVSYTVEDSNSGFLISGEMDAGLSLAISPNIQIGAGVFAGMTSGAPIVTNPTAITDVVDSDPVAILGQGNWQNYGLKGSITARF